MSGNTRGTEDKAKIKKDENECKRKNRENVSAKDQLLVREREGRSCNFREKFYLIKIIIIKGKMNEWQ